MEKTINKILAAILAVTITAGFSGCNTLSKISEIKKAESSTKNTTSAHEKTTAVPNPHFVLKADGYYYQHLNPAQQEGYRNMIKELDNHPARIILPSLSEEEIAQMFTAVCYDNPSLVCLTGAYTYTANGDECFIAPKYSRDGDTCGKMTEQLKQSVDEAMACIPEGADDYGKELALHDWLVNCCKNLDTGKLGKNAYDALVSKAADSFGYARAMQLLLNQAGVANYLAVGTVKDLQLKVTEHMWNIVTINGKNYHLDVNLNDPINTMKDSLQHFYFNLSDEEIAVDHYDYTPADNQCVSTDANFYRMENLMFDIYDDSIRAQLKQMIKEMAENHTYFIEIRFSSPAAYIEGKKDIIDANGIDHIIKQLNPSLGKNKLSRDMLYWSYTERYNTLRFEFTYESEKTTTAE